MRGPTVTVAARATSFVKFTPRSVSSARVRERQSFSSAEPAVAGDGFYQRLDPEGHEASYVNMYCPLAGKVLRRSDDGT
jgi:hypothetical protein